GGTAHWRNRRAYGARRANARRPALDHQPGNEAGRDWTRDWNRCRVCSRAIAQVTAVRSFGEQSGAARWSDCPACCDRAARLLVAGASRHSGRSCAGIAYGIEEQNYVWGFKIRLAVADEGAGV